VDTIERSIAGGRTVLGSTRAGVVLSAVLGVALTVYTAMSLSGNASRPMTLLPIALLIGATLLVVALNDLETFVLAALAVRSSLDVFRGGSHLGDPSVVLGLLLLGFGALWLLNRRMKLGDAFPTSRLGLAFLVFTGVAMLGILTSAKPGASLVEWSRIASIAVLFLCVEQFVARGAGLGRFLVAIGMAVIVPTAVAACQLVTRQGLHTSGVFSRITGTFAHSNPLAYFAIFTWFLMLATYPVVRGTSRRLVLIALVATTALTFFSFTRSAWIVAAIGLLILLLRRRSYTAVVAVCAVLLLGVAAPPIQSRFADLGSASQITGKPANSMSWRFAYWHKSLEIAEPSPIAGVGLRAVSMTTTAAKQPHNDIVRAYVELGIPGLVSYLALLALMIWSSFVAALDAGRRRLGGIERAVTEAALVTAIGIGLLSLVANLMSQVVVMAYAVTILALSSGAYLRRRRIDAERAKA